MTSSKALNVVGRIEQMCDFIENRAVVEAVDKSVPFTKLKRGPGALGFDIPLWVGLGIVGIWAALDAFAERNVALSARCTICGRASCVPGRFASHVENLERQRLAELEDLRHLYAHNYAGEADPEYFATSKTTRTRHVLARGERVLLTSGVEFDGERVKLELPHLRAYAQSARIVLQRFA